jgi:PAS domain S-box-containing protein
MRLSTQLTISTMALVAATVATVGVLAYRNIAAIAVQRTLSRTDAHVRMLANDLASMVASARADVTAFRDVIGLDEIIRLSRDPTLQRAGGQSLDKWRGRVAHRLVAELNAKPSYAQFRIIGVADGGREVIRVDRGGGEGTVRIVADADLQRKGDTDYFKQTIAARDGTVVVSPVDLNREQGVIETPHLPVVRAAAPVFAPDGQPFGIVIINVDMRSAFARLAAAAAANDTSLYVVNERGDYLVNPDAGREFGFDLGTPFRIQDDFPAVTPAIATGEQQPELMTDRAGRSFGVAVASTRLAGGPRLSLIETLPREAIVSTALSAIRDSSLLGGTAAMLGAIALAFLLARMLTRPLTEMTAAVTGFDFDGPLVVPLTAGGEIGALARAFKKMVREVREKSATMRRDAEVFTSIMTTIGEAVMLADRSGRIVYANRAYGELLGPRPEAGEDDRLDGFDVFRADDGSPVPLEQRPIARSLRGEPVDGYELLYRARGSDRMIHVLGSARPIRDAAGEQTGAVVVFRDVTVLKETERQLRHSQKLDAIGQLTGGIAHDFNNMLSVIVGTAEMLVEALRDRPDLLVLAKLIDQAADRGTELIGHLLAFSRKQPLQPRDVDVNRVVIDTVQLLRPTLGEHIEIEAMLEDDAQPALVDPSQLSTALLNLAINARDAMPGGGKLTLETGNVVLDDAYAQGNPDVQPGPYVMIVVSDTGCGMSAQVRDKVFEPFFTTKEVGKGTGLGLSMVYGFVKQSDGHIKIYSEEGHGTTIRLYLQRAHSQADAPAMAPTPIQGGGETILLVEDDAMVRDFVVTQLRSLGYTVVTAASGNAALSEVESGTAFDLLLTDVIMPGGMNGRQLADEVSRRRPGARILYTSGYSEDAIMHHGRLDRGMMLLSKPYRRSDLARMVRTALDRDAAVADRDAPDEKRTA